jgi:hypothetical protein
MKTKSFLILSFILLVLTRCSDDSSPDPTSDPASYFQYEGKKYSLDHGWIQHVENLTGGTDHTVISLYSDGMIWDDNLEEFTGKGHSIHITLRRSEEELVEGTYNYQSSTEGPYSLTISTASFSMNWDWQNNTGLYGYFREGSVIEITEEGGKHSLLFTLKPTLTLGNITSDVPVTGSFSGELTVIN